MSPLMMVHVGAGAVGLVTGFVALYAGKGSPLHRRVGMAFVIAMLTMTASAGFVMAMTGDVYTINLIAIALTTYLVVTALTAVRSPASDAAWLDRAAPIVGLAIGAISLTLGFDTAASESGTRQGIPPFPFFMFGTVGLLGGVLDIRKLRTGPLDARRRLTRHLWRMSFALFIAAMSFFLGQAAVIPEPIRSAPLLAMPPLLVLGTMLYWLWRVRIRGRFRGMMIRAPGATVPAMAPAKPLQTAGGRAGETIASSPR